MDISQIVDGLNGPQREAVTSDSQHLLVLAGAGSGKTRVLVHRIVYVMRAQGLQPQEVLAVTFTNKAAREMRHRLEPMLSGPVRNLWVGTFHGIAHRLLRYHWKEAGLPENFQVIDSDDQLRLVKRVIRELQIDEASFAPREAAGFINKQKDEGLRAASVPEGDRIWQATMKRIYLAYEKACLKAGIVDFGELLLRSHELWLQQPAILARYQQRFRHLLVDEFQDTNTIQYAWLRVLAGQQAAVTVVGDDDQSIYGWRGAKIENILSFQSDMGSTEVVRLEQNYRSTGNILKAANAVINNNPSRLGKFLWTDAGDGEPIDVYAAFNEQDEANYIVETIQTALTQARALQDIAILYRSNAQSRVIEEALVRHGVAYRVYGGLRFYDRLEIRNALAYLRLLRLPQDDAAFERIVNIPPRGIGAKTLAQIREESASGGGSLWQASIDLLQRGEIRGKAQKGLAQLVEVIIELQQLSTELSLKKLVAAVLDKSGLLQFHANEKGDKGEMRRENLQEMVNAVAEYDESADEPLAEFLANAALDAGEQQANEEQDAVQLMTLHSAKGLEFPLVFLVGMEEGLFPHSMSLEEVGRLEEERRLCYVGVTRAMNKLVLTFAECRRLYGQDKYNPVSRFVREIPTECLQEVRLHSVVTKPMFGQRARFDSLPGQAAHMRPNVDSGVFMPGLGSRVRHSKFGEGTVLNFEGDGAHARIQVKFEQLPDDQSKTSATKWLILSMAKLEPA
ncbi:MAG: DNA helicase II [unclassified Hahellaceae]|nr:DNA helicase II [Hahellaceae bacterium]|tara:strand:- start:22884 stop:25094 length:2211 start_codon:yes stop_codon:yes gene_type:complete